MHVDAPAREKLMQLVVQRANRNKAGAEELDLVLVSGNIPSYALIQRANSTFQVDRIRRGRNLDARPGGETRRERHMVICEGAWQSRKRNVGLAPSVSSAT